jgi:hypothetical protein
VESSTSSTLFKFFACPLSAVTAVDSVEHNSFRTLSRDDWSDRPYCAKSLASLWPSRCSSRDDNMLRPYHSSSLVFANESGGIINPSIEWAIVDSNH